MKVTIEDISPVQKRLSVEVPPGVVTGELDSAYKRLNRNVSIKGFRKGKAPRSVLERQYGPQMEGEVLERLIEQTLPEALKEANCILVLQPQLDSASPLKANEAFSYSAILDLWPEFELPEYKGLELVRPAVEVTEEEVTEQLEALRRHFATVDSVEEDRPVRDGDLAVIDYKGYAEGEEVEGLSEERYYLEVGAGYFNADFERQLVGMTKDAEKSIEVGYPEDAVNARVAGKTVEYRVKLRDIQKKVLPELNGEFAEKFGPTYKTVEDLRERLRRQIRSDKEDAVQSGLRQQVLEQLMTRVDFPIPERLVEEKLTQMLDNVSSHLRERGLDFDKTGLSEDRLRAKMRDDAVRQVKSELVMDKIADVENITVAQEDLSRHVEGQAQQMAGLDKAQIEAALTRHILPKLRAQRTMDFLLKHAVIKDVSGETGAGSPEPAVQEG
jgi:trigger factor